MNKTLCAIGAGVALLPAIAGAQANVQVDANTVVRASIPLVAATKSGSTCTAVAARVKRSPAFDTYSVRV